MFSKIKRLRNKEKAGFNWNKLLFWLALAVLFVGIVGLSIATYFYFNAPYNLDTLFQAQSTVIMDKEGNELYIIHGDENRKIIPISEISEHVVHAVLAIEDDQFYNHIGIDAGGIGRAVLHEFFGIGARRGGSTITQQLAKNLFLTRERSYMRKLKEMFSALRIEANYSKDQILANYLNTISFGNNAYGIELAANIYFGKTAKELTVGESAILAALPNAPTYFSPYGPQKYSYLKIDTANLEDRNIESEADLAESEVVRGLLGKLVEVSDNKRIYVRGRVDLILRRMNELGYITDEEKDIAWQQTQEIEFNKYRQKIKAPHFVMYVKQLLETKYGKELVEGGGLKVYTSIDPKLQETAEKLVAEIGEKNENTYGTKNGSLVSIDVKNGHILAMVGARDYFDTENDGNVNVALQYRLPGSSFKPFVYVAAFLKGYAPSTVVYDVETDFGAGYKPKNFDGKFSGPVTLRKSLGHSLNIPAVKAGHLGGIPETMQMVRQMGIDLPQSEDWYGLSLSLGAGEVRLLDMVTAYSVFANGGVKHDPVAILKIEDSEGNILEEWVPKGGQQVLDPQAAYLITDVLSDQGARGAGWNKYLQVGSHVVASKTGTSNKKIKEKTLPADAWTVGYTPSIATGVWTGNNDGSVLRSNATGLGVAGPIYHGFMSAALEDKEVEQFTRPEGIRFARVTTTSGKLPSSLTPEDKVKSEMFASFNIPTEVDDVFVEVEVDSITGLLASDACPAQAVEKRTFINHHSVLPDKANWQNPVLAWAQKWYSENEVIPGTIGAPPTESCKIEEGDPRWYRPKITITSPTDTGVVSAPSIGVWVDIQTKNNIEKVDFYWNDEKVDTQTRAPYKGTIRISKRLREGSLHTIKVVVTDEFFNTSEESITVKVGTDNEDPNVSIVYPEKDMTFEPGSTLNVQIRATDAIGDIESLALQLNGKTLSKNIDYPYNFSLTVPETTGTHTLNVTATDTSGNTASQEVQFISKEGKEQSSSFSLDIIAPKTGSTFEEGELVPVRIFANEDLRKNLDRIEVQRKTGNQTVTITEISNITDDNNGTFEVGIRNLFTGKHTLFVKGYPKQGSPKFSKRINITIEGDSELPTVDLSPSEKEEDQESENPQEEDSSNTNVESQDPDDFIDAISGE